MGASEHHEASCPRCGYDLAGVVTTWSGSCPVRGRCSECGLGFFWGDVLNERLRALPWLYEHARRAWDLRAWFATLWRALLPWSFWKRVQVHHRVRPWRLLLWLIAGPAVISLATLAVYHASVEVANATWSQTAGPPGGAPATTQREWVRFARAFGPVYYAHLFSVGAFGTSWMRTGAPWWPIALPPVGFATFAAFGMAVCRSEWRGASLAPSHCARVGVYLLTPTMLLFCAVLLVSAVIPLEIVSVGLTGGGRIPAGPQPWHVRTLLMVMAFDFRPAGLGVLLWQGVALCWALRHGLRMSRWFLMALVGFATGGAAAYVGWVGGPLWAG